MEENTGTTVNTLENVDTEASSKRFCTNCGTELKADAKFCTNCGKAVNEANAAAPEEFNVNPNPKKKKGKKILFIVLGVLAAIIIALAAALAVSIAEDDKKLDYIQGEWISVGHYKDDEYKSYGIFAKTDGMKFEVEGDTFTVIWQKSGEEYKREELGLKFKEYDEENGTMRYWVTMNGKEAYILGYSIEDEFMIFTMSTDFSIVLERP